MITKTTRSEKRGRLYHRAAKYQPGGQVSALCYTRPRAIAPPRRPGQS